MRTNLLRSILTVGIALSAPAIGAAADSPSSTLSLSRAGDQVKITFSGTLQSADTVRGPWTDLTNTTSPKFESITALQKYFRTRDSGVGSIFASQSIVSLILTAPFQTNFDKAFAGSPDGIIPPIRQKPYFDARLEMAAFDLPVTMRVRGNSSLQECPFPKMKFKVGKEERPGTPFADAREIRIGTHCAEGGRGNIGRLRDERATFREALAYETMELLGFVSPRVRRARIEYHDTSPTNAGAMDGWQVTRNAVIHEDIEVVGERLGDRALEDEELPALTKASFEDQLITDLQFLHALLGNWDYGLFQDDKGLWNTEVVELADKTLIPVAGDFDLASWVTGEVRLSVPTEYLPDLPEIDRQAHYDVEQIQKRVSAASFQAARDRFVPLRAAMEGQINSAEVDDDGRTNALHHVTAFFDALAAAKP